VGGMYGRAFETMYKGSLVGAGLAVFGVWNYAIAHVRKSRVELNPRHLALVLTGNLTNEAELEKAIEWLCRKDPKSRNKDNGGARLVKEGEYQYFMPSYAEYDKIKTPEDLRAYNRRKQAEHRHRKEMAKLAKESMTGKSYGSTAERLAVKAMEES